MRRLRVGSHRADARQQGTVDENLNASMRAFEIEHELLARVCRIYLEVQPIPIFLAVQRALAAAGGLIDKGARYVRVVGQSNLLPRSSAIGALHKPGARIGRRVIRVLEPPLTLRCAGARGRVCDVRRHARR